MLHHLCVRSGKHTRPVARARQLFQRIVIVVVCLVMAVMVWGVQQLRVRPSGTSSPVERESQRLTGQGSPVDDYLQFVRSTANTGAVDDTTLIVEGLRTLAGAIGALNLGTVDVQVRLRVAAEHVLVDSTAVSTVEAVRDSLLLAADAIDMGADGDGALPRLAMSIQTDRPLTEQRATFLEFFRSSAIVIRRVAAI